MKGGRVYILASPRNGTLYIGVTANLAARMMQHRAGTGSFAGRYILAKLVHAEYCERSEEAIAREKALTKRRGPRKLALIEEGNPELNDLFEHICRA